MKKLSLTFFLLVSAFSYGGSFTDKFSDYGDKLRPFVKKFLGKKRTDKIFGEEKSGISLPPIPNVKRDARNIDLLKKKKRKGSIKKLSPEKKRRYDLAFIREVSKITRNLKSKNDEDQRWLNVMSQGGTREGVYRGIVLDDRYKRLERGRYPVGQKVAEFSVYYANNFLSQDLKLSAVSSSNFYTLKKVLVERSLEVLDSFPSNKDDIYDWYAVFSGYLARKYPNLWKNRLRKNKNLKSHKAWSKNVPEQHLKSEVIIKLHKTFNYILNR
jgi:hypothetical protein